MEGDGRPETMGMGFKTFIMTTCAKMATTLQSCKVQASLRETRLSAIAFHALKGMWGKMGHLQRTSKEMYADFDNNRVATSYSDAISSWLFVYNKDVLLVYRSDLVRQLGTETEGPAGDLARVCSEMRSGLKNLSNLYNRTTRREIDLIPILDLAQPEDMYMGVFEEQVFGHPDLHYKTFERNSVQMIVLPPFKLATLGVEFRIYIETSCEEMMADEPADGSAALKQQMCEECVRILRERESTWSALKELRELIPGCFDVWLRTEGTRIKRARTEGTRIKRTIESNALFAPLSKIFEGIGVTTIRNWVEATFGLVDDKLNNLMVLTWHFDY
jgi:hypothetical protein